MPRHPLALVSAFSFLICAAPMALAKPVVRVTVPNVEARTGPVMVALYDEAGWDKGAPVAAASVAATAASVTVSLAAPREGRFGVKIYQDLNNDRALGRGMFGIPNEPWGASNDAPANFGPPSFKDAAFDVGAQGASQTVRLR